MQAWDIVSTILYSTTNPIDHTGSCESEFTIKKLLESKIRNKCENAYIIQLVANISVLKLLHVLAFPWSFSLTSLTRWVEVHVRSLHSSRCIPDDYSRQQVHRGVDQA